LKQAIRDSGRPVESVASDAGLSPALVAGFMAGERDIHMATADKLAQALGLEVTAD
jgi:transcriptional regulator with XRE-family HTH domain